MTFPLCSQTYFLGPEPSSTRWEPAKRKLAGNVFSFLFAGIPLISSGWAGEMNLLRGCSCGLPFESGNTSDTRTESPAGSTGIQRLSAPSRAFLRAGVPGLAPIRSMAVWICMGRAAMERMDSCSLLPFVQATNSSRPYEGKRSHSRRCTVPSGSAGCRAGSACAKLPPPPARVLEPARHPTRHN